MKFFFQAEEIPKEIDLNNNKNEIIISLNPKSGKNISINIGKKSKNKIVLIGDGCNTKIKILGREEGPSTKIYGLFSSKDKNTTNANIETKLTSNNTKAIKHFVSIIGNNGIIDISANIFIAPNTKNTEGRLLEENIIIGKNTKIKALPMLDIQSNDVSASHGMKIERIDKKKLFYMNARGISKEIAQKLIIKGHINKIVNEISILSNEQKNKLGKKILKNIL